MRPSAPRQSPRTRNSAFTLIELTMAMVIIGIISAVITPVILSATDTYATSRTLRSESQNIFFAIDRITSIVREAPPGTATRLGVSNASPTSLVFSDGTGFRLNGTDIEMTGAQGNAPLARDVSGLTITFLDDDGQSPPDQPANAHRLRVAISSGSQDFVFYIFPRVNVGEPG